MNKIKKIQDMLMNELERLSDDEHMKVYNKKEVSRSQAIAQSASTFIKSVNLNLKVIEMSKKHNIKIEDLKESIGIDNE